jgi:hypothetical protein
MKLPTAMKLSTKSILSLIAASGLLVGLSGSLWAADPKADAASGADNTTIKGEVIDLVCYTDGGLSGEEHAGCAKVCIKAGLPVGLKATDGKVYVLVGDHKPMNSELVEYAAKTITMKGKLVSRDGINMLENAEIVK